MLKKISFKIILTFCLLLYLIWFAIDQGEVFSNFSWRVCSINVVIFLAIVILNSILLRWITFIFINPLTLMEAILITSIGAFANAAGGLPVGTVLVMGILVKKHNYDLQTLFMGKVLASGLSILSLFLIFSLSFLLGGKLQVFGLTIFILMVIMLILYLVLRYRFQYLFNDLKQESLTVYLFRGYGIALMSATLMVTSYCLIIDNYIHDISIHEAIAMSSLSLMVGFGVLANTIGGFQELIVGMSAVIYSMDFSFGVELGLFIRFCSIIASFVIFIVSVLLINGKLSNKSMQ